MLKKSLMLILALTLVLGVTAFAGHKVKASKDVKVEPAVAAVTAEAPEKAPCEKAMKFCPKNVKAAVVKLTHNGKEMVVKCGKAVVGTAEKGRKALVKGGKAIWGLTIGKLPIKAGK